MSRVGLTRTMTDLGNRSPLFYDSSVHAGLAAVWGVVGGAVVEAYDTAAVVRATGRWPWLDAPVEPAEMSAAARWNAFFLWLFAVVIRVAAGGGTAAAASSQISGDLAAFGLGVAGPLALERILALVPASGPPATEPATGVPASGPSPGTPAGTAVEASDAV